MDSGDRCIGFRVLYPLLSLVVGRYSFWIEFLVMYSFIISIEILYWILKKYFARLFTEDKIHDNRFIAHV